MSKPTIVSGAEPWTEAQFSAWWESVLSDEKRVAERRALVACHAAAPHEYVDVGSTTPRCLECHRSGGKHNSRCPNRGKP